MPVRPSVRIRTATPSDLDTLRDLVAVPSVNTTTIDVLDRNLSDGSNRPEWVWLAEREGALVAASVWWGFPSGAYPLAIDALLGAENADPGELVETWAALLSEAISALPPGAERPEYHFFLPPQWRDDTDLLAGLEPRWAAAAAAGLTDRTERLRYEWTDDVAVPSASTRLTFRPESDDAVFLDLFAQVTAGSLDAATAREVARGGPEAAARADLEAYTSMPGKREWWRVAFDVSGVSETVVGFALPSANNGGPVVGYLGVLPEHRGQGYADDLLSEITRVLVRAGADRIRADTDVRNVPMAASFDRVGYRVFAIRLVLSEPA